MTWLDLFLTPFYLLVLYLLVYKLKPRVTDRNTAKYFIPGYTVKVAGAIMLGLIYQFYYGGGDTFNFYRDSTHIFNAFTESPYLGFKLLFANDRLDPELYSYTSRMYFIEDGSSIVIIKMAGVLALFAFNSYTIIAVMLASISYSGLWALYKTFYRLYPHLYKPFAYAVLFVPSVFFWGSGYLKDTITLGAVGWVVYAVYQFFIGNKKHVQASLIFLVACYVLYGLKIYILLCLLPALILWIFLKFTAHIKSSFFRFVVTPLVMVMAAGLGFVAVKKVGEGNSKYSLEAMAETAEVTARWLSYVSETQGGSVYDLGDFDYSNTGMMKKALPAINVTLFRPYVWEVNNVVMLLSALESLFLLLFTLYVFLRKGPINVVKYIGKDPTVLFCLIFSLSFSFAIGISTYNFGTLVRYKIPMLPFYLMAFIIMLHPVAKRIQLKRRRKLVRLEATEKSVSTVRRARLPI